MGKKGALATALIYLTPLFLGFALTGLSVSAEAAPLRFARFTHALFGAGLALLVLAKASLLRRGIYVSFGSSAMSPWNRRAYRSGYALMLLGLLATLALLMVPGRDSAL